MLRWFLADLRTGRQIRDLQVASGKWERYLNAPESLSAVMDMRDPATIALRLRLTAAPGRTVLAVAADDVILAAGPIWAHSYNRDEKTLELTARGLWSYYDHRFVLPVVAATVGVTQFTIPDASAAGKTKPNPALGTYLTGMELGTIAKRWVQQAHAWTGGMLPVVFEADRSGPSDANHERNFEGAAFKNLGTVLEQLTEVEGGPDIVFQPRLTDDRLGIEWDLRTGTDAEPFLSSTNKHRWNLDVPQSPVSGFSIDVDASDIAGTAWVTGGRSGDSVMVGRSIDPTLTDAGYPLFESLDSSHSSVDVQATLDRYASEATVMGRGPVEQWSFKVEANARPYLGAFWEGDFCEIELAAYGQREIVTDGFTSDVDGYDTDTGFTEDAEGYDDEVGFPTDPEGYSDSSTMHRMPMVGDPYLFEGGTFEQRIIGIGGDEKGLVVNVTLAPVNPE